MATFPYNSLYVCANNFCGGQGVNTPINRTNFSGTVKAVTNIFDAGTFKYDWERVYNKYKKYIDTSLFNLDKLNKIEWNITGWDCLLAPQFVYKTGNIYSMVDAKLISVIPEIIYTPIATIIANAVDDNLEELITEYSLKELFVDLLKGMPNTCKTGYFIFTNATYSNVDDDYISIFEDTSNLKIAMVTTVNDLFYSNIDSGGLTAVTSNGPGINYVNVQATTETIPAGKSMLVDTLAYVYPMTNLYQ